MAKRRKRRVRETQSKQKAGYSKGKTKINKIEIKKLEKTNEKKLIL